MSSGNAFSIPEKSFVLRSKASDFPRKAQKYPRNMPPIALPGSSKHPPPTMMSKANEESQQES